MELHGHYSYLFGMLWPENLKKRFTPCMCTETESQSQTSHRVASHLKSNYEWPDHF